ncbi:MAG: DUF4304 domain-containing protein [Clostridia bacterium]|nr:DUF4304 domain-containing protein [Clostridia bacterium]
MKTIQEEYKDILKEEIAPRLRAIGFKGSGQNYSIPSESHWAFVGFQKSMRSNSEQIIFTINIFVISKEKWAKTREISSHLPEKPSSKTNLVTGWSKRIGELLPKAEDHWWTFDKKTEKDQLVSELLEAIEKYSLPQIKTQIDNA